jgi:hypothetical protein
MAAGTVFVGQRDASVQGKTRYPYIMSIRFGEELPNSPQTRRKRGSILGNIANIGGGESVSTPAPCLWAAWFLPIASHRNATTLSLNLFLR